MSEATPKRPVRLTIGGRERKFRLGFAEMAEFDEIFGCPIFEGLGKQPFRAIQHCIWLGLRDGDRTVTLKKASEFVQEFLSDGGKLENLSAAIMDALKFSGIITDEPDHDAVDAEGNASAGPDASA